MDCIRDLLADICLVGAGTLTALLAATTCGRWLLRGAAAVRPCLLAFMVLAAVAMNFAQKSGTNGLMRTMESAEAAVAGTENGWGRMADGLPQPPFRVAEGASAPSMVEMFRLEFEAGKCRRKGIAVDPKIDEALLEARKRMKGEEFHVGTIGEIQCRRIDAW